MAYIKICCIFSLLCALSTTAIATGSRSANEICKSLMQAKSYLFYRTDQFVLVSPLQYICRNFNLFLLSICFCHLSTAINLSYCFLFLFLFFFLFCNSFWSCTWWWRICGHNLLQHPWWCGCIINWVESSRESHQCGWLKVSHKFQSFTNQQHNIKGWRNISVLVPYKAWRPTET